MYFICMYMYMYMYMDNLRRMKPCGHTGSGGPVHNAAIESRRRLPPPKHLDIFKGAPFRLPTPLSDQFPVRVCSCPLHI